MKSTIKSTVQHWEIWTLTHEESLRSAKGGKSRFGKGKVRGNSAA